MIHEIGVFLNPSKAGTHLDNLKDKEFLKSDKYSGSDKEIGRAHV